MVSEPFQALTMNDVAFTRKLKKSFFQWIKIIISGPPGTQDETFSLPESPISVLKSDVDIAENSLFSSGETASFSYLAFAFPLTSKKMVTRGFK